jgi:hypothetical protein
MKEDFWPSPKDAAPGITFPKSAVLTMVALDVPMANFIGIFRK